MQHCLFVYLPFTIPVGCRSYGSTLRIGCRCPLLPRLLYCYRFSRCAFQPHLRLRGYEHAPVPYTFCGLGYYAGSADADGFGLPALPLRGSGLRRLIILPGSVRLRGCCLVFGYFTPQDPRFTLYPDTAPFITGLYDACCQLRALRVLVDCLPLPVYYTLYTDFYTRVPVASFFFACCTGSPDALLPRFHLPQPPTQRSALPHFTVYYARFATARCILPFPADGGLRVSPHWDALQVTGSQFSSVPRFVADLLRCYGLLLHLPAA